MAPLPPPPPPPPRLPPPPPPAASIGPHLGGHVYDHERSRWGLGDAFSAFAIYLIVSLLIFGVFAVVAGTTTTPRGLWLPALVVVPAACQFAFVIWVGQRQGAGVIADFRAQIRLSDAALGLGLFLAALLAAGIVAQLMTEIVGEPPTAAVADLIEDSTGRSGDSTPGPSSESSPRPGSGTLATTGSGNNLTVGIYLLALLGATFVPIAEELLFRGLWWSALEKRGVHQLWSLVITSAVFAAFHFEPWRTPVLFVLGVVIGLGRITTGRIGASIFAHIYINALGMTALLIELS